MHVAILGPLEVRGDDGQVIDVAGARLRALVIRMALAAGSPVAVPALVDALWGERPPADEANALQTLVSRLRRALGGAAMVGQGPGGYRLGIEREDVDAHRFERLAAEGSAALRASEPQRALSLLTEALALWRGSALADAGEFAEVPAARLHDLRLAALVDRIDADVTLGRAAGVVAELEALAAEHPLHERLTGLRMRALAATGRQAEALGTYERLRAQLADELGVDPSVDLQAIHLAVLRGERSSAPPEEQAARRTNLRAQLTSFVGRDDEVVRIGKSLEENRLVTLVGPGGAGKTRLANEAAARIIGGGPPGNEGVAAGGGGPPGNEGVAAGGGGVTADGVWFVELASVTDAGDLPQTILGSLGIRELHLLERRAQLTARDATTRLEDVLSDKRALLILDNCEHLVDGCALLADDLLARCPGLQILTTSREPLGITGEALLVVAPLGRPTPDASLARAMDFPSVRLFADRAAAARPEFAVDETTAPAVIQIVQRLDGLPLAIELAAARLRTLPLAEIAERLSDRFRLLTGGSRTALPRHRTLRAVVDWSWDLLTPGERLLAERLSVFPAGATSASASAVCSDVDVPETDIADLLSSLVDKSLLQPVAEGARLRMLETIREYGAERLVERGELVDARARHADYFTELLRDAAPHLLGAEQLPWFELLSAERDNLLAAQRFRCDSGDADGALEIGVTLGSYAMLLGNHSEVVGLVADALQVDGGTDTRWRRVAQALYTIHTIMDSPPTGEVSPEDATRRMREIGEQLDSVEPEWHPLVGLMKVAVAFMAGDAERANRYVAEAMATGNAWTAASVLMLRANLAENEGDVAAMRVDTEAALAEFRRLGERWGTASTLRAMGLLHTYAGDLDAADEAYAEALGLMAELNSRDDEGFMRVRMADLRARRGDLDGARDELERARVAAEATGSAMESLLTQCAAAAVEREAGNLDRARCIHDEVMAQAGNIAEGHPALGHARTMVLIMSVSFAAADGRLEDAHRQAGEALETALGTKDKPIIAAVGVGLAELATREGLAESGARLLGAAAALRGVDDLTALDITRLTRELTASLGADGFRSAYNAGLALSHDDALALFERST